MFKIPFGWMPGHWGLKGTTREIAKAEYELDGIDLDMKVAEIRLTGVDLEREKLTILRRYNQISIEEFEQKITDLGTFDDPKKKELAKLDLDYNYKKINRDEYEKTKANILEEPWVSMPVIHWDPLGKNRTYFELDYNEHFIKHLRKHGYTGTKDEDVINLWLNDICISISEEITGLDGEFVIPSRRSIDDDGQ